MKNALIVLAALALAGCVSHNFREGERTHFRCDGGKEFSLRRVPPAIEVYASGATHRLEPAGEGEYRSADGAITYSRDGRALAGIYNGPFENCRRRVRWSRFF
jgi:hypothetical protein